MEQLDSHWTDFDEISYLSFLRKSVKGVHVSSKSDKNNGYCYNPEDGRIQLTATEAYDLSR
jgi:hypothetical protein